MVRRQTARLTSTHLSSRHGFEVDGPDEYQGGRRWEFRQSPMCEHGGDGPYLIQFASGALSAGCHHNSCGWTWHDLRQKFEPKPDSGLYDRLLHKLSGNGNGSGGAASAVPDVFFQRVTSAELASGKYEVQFAIEGALVLGQPLTIGGPMKSLKTSILIDAAVSLASGGYFLGRLKVNQPRRVLVMSGESGLATIQETARRISDSAGVRLADLGNLIWSPDIPRFSNPTHLAALEKFLTGDAIEILFCDPAYLAMPSADAGNLMAQGELLRNVADVCRQCGVTLDTVPPHETKHGARRFRAARAATPRLGWPR